MTYRAFNLPSASSLNPGAQEFIPNVEHETLWGDECGGESWGKQTMYNENQWELAVNKRSAQWGQQQQPKARPVQSPFDWERQAKQMSKQSGNFGWEDKANRLSAIWSHPPEFEDLRVDTVFQPEPPDAYQHAGSMSPLSVAETSDTSFIEFQLIAATPCTSKLHTILQDSLNLDIPYSIITSTLVPYLMIKPPDGRAFFYNSELEQVCLTFWAPIMAEYECPIRVRYTFDRIREDKEWAQVCNDYKNKVQVLWVGEVSHGNIWAASETLRIWPAPSVGTALERKLLSCRKKTRKTTDLALLSSLHYLESVVLHALPVVDISAIVRLPSLRELNISKTMVENFDSLSELVSLESLNVHGTKFCDLTCLPSANLKSLRAKDTLVQDLSSLVFCQKLSLLELSGCPVQNLEPLAVLRSLKYLYLSKTAVFDIYPLSAIATLKFLDLSFTSVSDVHPLGISLSRHHTLEYVNLDGTAVTDFAPVRSICVIGKTPEDSTEEWGSMSRH